MKTNKSKKFMLSNSEHSKEVTQQSQALSKSKLNNQFWTSLKETINMKKENQSIKGRIISAKRILTPIIQELMKDALKQIEAENLDEAEVNMEMKGKEVKVLYNNLKAADIWPVQKDVVTDGEEWAMRILREISRDFEQPFDELHEKIELKEIEQHSSKDILLSTKLLTKLGAIYQHLGNIIERLNERCRKRRIVDTEDSLDDLSNQRINFQTSYSTDTGCSTPRKFNEQINFPCHVHSFRISQRKVGYPSQKHNLSVNGSRIQFTVENACSAINFENTERAAYSISRKLLHDVAVSYHAFFEENKNNVGNKEIVIKCLEDLEKVRNYLEAIRDNRQCEKPKFSDLESCKNDECLESQPHLHSNLHNMPMVLKLNKHAEDNEDNSDLIIGIPSLNKSSPDVHILLNTKDQHVDIKHGLKQANRIENRSKTPYRVSRIPKPIDKKRMDMEKFVGSKCMKISLENKQSSERKNANLLIFDPDDPSKSIIKMKEQKMKVTNDSRSIVSNACLTLTQNEDLISYLIFCCIGGKYTALEVNMYVWLLLKWIKKSCSESIFFHIMGLYVFIFYSNFLLSVAEYARKCLIPKIPCFMQKNSWRNKSMGLQTGYDRDLSCVHNLFSYFSLMEFSMGDTFRDKKALDEKNIYRQKIFKKYQPWPGRHYRVYFFECFKENKETRSSGTSSQRRWNYQSLNSETYPIWTIKRSKYYSVPQGKKKDEMDLKKLVGSEKEDDDQVKLSEVDSLEISRESRKEIHLQISEVSLRSVDSPRVGVLETGSDKLCQKAEIKRKVSFREEVDVSEPALDKSADDPELDYNILPDAHYDGQEHPNDMEYTNERSAPLDIQGDINELSTRISDLLMTDSLMQIAEDMPKYDTKRSKQASKKSSPRSLKLTDSARHALAKLSKSFEKELYGSVSDTLDTDMAGYFYDETGNPITEVHNSDGDLLFNFKDDIVDRLTTVLFDSDGTIHKNMYDANGRCIKVVYDENGRLVGSVQESNEKIKCIQADLDVVQYYDYKGKPIKHLYDSSGCEIRTVGRDFTSKIFNADGTLQIDIYTQLGKRIDAVYDSDGRLMGRVSYSQLQPLLRREHVRVANMDEDSLNKLFESKSQSVKFQYEDIKGQSESPKRFFDQEGNLLVGVYNKRGKPIKLTSSGEADELIPFLFDKKGKLQNKRYDSNGKELKEVFGEDGKAISEMSIAWLNDLLASSKKNIPKKKKKESIFRRISKHKTKKEKLHDIKNLYDSNGRIITSIFDSKGKPLAVSLSGDAKKFVPFLFDKGGQFIKKRYDSEKRKLRCVYGMDGNIISSISVTCLERVAANSVCEQDGKESEDKALIEESIENGNSGQSEETKGKTFENNESYKNVDYSEKVPNKLYDKNGNVLNEIFDDGCNLSESSSYSNARKVLPQLFDDNGQLLKSRFGNQGMELSSVYNNEGCSLNDDLSTAIKIEAGKTLVNPDEDPEDANEEKACMERSEGGGADGLIIDENYRRNPKPNEYKHNTNQNSNESKDRSLRLKIPPKASSAAPPKTSSKPAVTEKKSHISKANKLHSSKEKHVHKQPKRTTPIALKQSMNQNIDIPEISLKAGESIYRFYDERGNVITELFDVRGKALIKTRTGKVEKLAKLLFDHNGFLNENVYNQKGRRITRIFDQKKRSVSRISVASSISGVNMLDRPNLKDAKLHGSVHDKYGSLVKEIYDKKGHPMIITSHAKLQELAPVIFDEMGVRRRIYNKSGNEIGPVYDHKGNVLNSSPNFKKSKPSNDCKGSSIFSISGRPLRNFYDSNGTLIIALYNDYGKTLCRVKKGVDNVELLSKFFFDKHGNFLKGRFYDYRGDMIKQVHDSKGEIVRTIRRTENGKIAHHKNANRRSEKVSAKRNIENANKLNHRMNLNSASRQKQREYHGQSDIRPVEDITGTISSQSDTMLNPEEPTLQRPMSAYSLREYSLINDARSSPSPSLTDKLVKKFYDEAGRLLTGVYNSKTRLLGFSDSGNARVLAPFLFDSRGNFISGRYNSNRKPLKHVYDSDGKSVDKISKLFIGIAEEETQESKKLKGPKIDTLNTDVIASIEDLHDKTYLDNTDSCKEIGEIKDKLSIFRGSELKSHGNYDIIRNKPAQEVPLDFETSLSEERIQKERLGLKDRISALSNLKDKILTVIFDKQHRICKKLSIQTIQKSTKLKTPKKNNDEGRSHSTKSHLYDKDFSVIKEIYDGHGKKIKRVYNSSGRLICELYSISGTLVKNNVLKSMFQKNVFMPKVYDSEGKIISKIFANKKLLKNIYDAKGAPAKVDSDLIYLVSKQSLPDDEVSKSSKPKHVNYFSEGSTYPFPEEQNQNGPIQNQQLTEGKNYETEIEVAFNGYSKRRTDNCTCEQCQNMGKNRKSFVQFGEELLERLSRFTIPLTKFLPRNLLRREIQDDSEESKGESDSLDTLIDEARSKEDSEETDKEYYGSCSRVSLLESEEHIPISRKMVEKTLKKCVHLNSSTELVGKISDTVLQHFANLILREIEETFFQKLDVLQCNRSSSLVFDCHGEKDICIGTELKFEDSLIGKHISAQTIDAPKAQGQCHHPCGCSMEISTRNIELPGYFNDVLSGRDRDYQKAFVCKVPNVQTFIMTMKTNMETLGNSIEE